MKYHSPQTVTSPRDYVSNVRVIYDGGDGSFSVAKIDWEGQPCLVMRWNVARREWHDAKKVAGNKTCAGMPTSRGYPVWFVIPDELLDSNSEVWRLIREKTKSA